MLAQIWAQYAPIFYIMFISITLVFGFYHLIRWVEEDKPIEKYKAGMRLKLMWVDAQK